MPRRLLIYAGLLLLLLLSSSCAERNTEYQPDEWLTLEREIPVVGNPLDIAVDDQYVYLAQDQGGISITRLSDYQHRWITKITAADGSEMSLGLIKKIFILPEAKRLFLNEVEATDKITIINTTNPDSLVYRFDFQGGTVGIRQLGAEMLSVPQGPHNMAVSYCADGNFSYDLYDGEIGRINSFNLSPKTPATGFALSQIHVFLSAEQLGLFIYDRTNQQLISNLPLPGEAQKVILSGNLAIVSSRQAGINIVDVSNPGAPVLKSTFDTSGYATVADVWGSKVAVSSGGGGIYLLDISNPAEPELLQHLSSCGYTNSVKFISNEKLAVASRDKGLLIYKIK